MQYYGCADDRFSWQAFGSQPDWLIFQALEFFGRQRRLEANSNAGVHTIGWSGLFNGFAGKDAQKVEAIDLLPFPSEAQAEKRRVGGKTASILAGLVNENRMPLRVAATVRQMVEVVDLLEEDHE